MSPLSADVRRVRSLRVDLEALALAAPLLTLLILAILRKGAFFRPDIVVSPALVLALALSTPQVRTWCRQHLAAVAAGIVATGWWIGDALLSHHSVDSWRLPSAWLCMAAGYGCARSLPPAARRVVQAGVAVTGVALAVAGLVLVGVRVDALDFARRTVAAVFRTVHLPERGRPFPGDRAHCRHRNSQRREPLRLHAPSPCSGSSRPTAVALSSASRSRCASATSGANSAPRSWRRSSARHCCCLASARTTVTRSC